MKYRKFLFLILYIFPYYSLDILYAQNYNKIESQIDIDLQEANDLFSKRDYQNAYTLYLEAANNSKKNNYSKGKSEGYIGAARSLFSSRELGKSTRLLLAAKKEEYSRSNPKIMSDIYFYLGLNLHNLQMVQPAIENYNNSIEYANKISNNQVRITSINRNL